MKSSLALALFALVAASAAYGAPVNPNMGAVTGHGILNDHDGNKGVWQVRANLHGGNFSGQLGVVLGGKTLIVTLQPGRAYYENGTCVLRGENGRSRFELRGKCDTTSFGPGTVDGYFDGDRSLVGEFSGSLAWGASESTEQKAGAVPTGKLMCAYRERVGGIVAGDLPNYQTRYSSLVSLTLDGGTYRTRNSTGRYVVHGDKVRFTSGALTGATAELRPDRSGEPAVFFPLESNLRANGTFIVDPWSTTCAKQN